MAVGLETFGNHSQLQLVLKKSNTRGLYKFRENFIQYENLIYFFIYFVVYHRFNRVQT